MHFENVLILGSKAPCKVPDLSFEEIFSSNGSAELAHLYNSYFKEKKTLHSCVIGGRSFLKIDDIKNRVINSKPDNLVVRGYNDVSEDLSKLFVNKINIIKYTKREQFFYQSKFFKQGLTSLIKAEYKYQNKLTKKLIHLFDGFFRHGFLGVSSGFFALLYASVKHPKANLIISGLSFSGGSHYYGKDIMTANRGSVDTILLNSLLESLKKRIFITDKEVAAHFKLKEYKGEILNI